MTTVLIMLITGLKVLISSQKHALTLLITIEFILLASMMLLSSNLLMTTLPHFTIIIFLTLIACEGALGLTLIINLSRVNGNDYLTSSSITPW